MKINGHIIAITKDDMEADSNIIIFPYEVEGEVVELSSLDLSVSIAMFAL